jgi:hypothetical protein
VIEVSYLFHFDVFSLNFKKEAFGGKRGEVNFLKNLPIKNLQMGAFSNK